MLSFPSGLSLLPRRGGLSYWKGTLPWGVLIVLVNQVVVDSPKSEGVQIACNQYVALFYEVYNGRVVVATEDSYDSII
jgi:hypothetical protein